MPPEISRREFMIAITAAAAAPQLWQHSAGTLINSEPESAEIQAFSLGPDGQRRLLWRTDATVFQHFDDWTFGAFAPETGMVGGFELSFRGTAVSVLWDTIDGEPAEPPCPILAGDRLTMTVKT